MHTPRGLIKRTSGIGPVYYVSPQLEALGVRHAFSTRVGGVSGGPFASMNLGNPNGCAVQDEVSNIAENYGRLMAAMDCQGRRREWLHQVHGCTVYDLMSGQAFDTGNARGDALVSGDATRVLSMRVADCAPVLLASAEGRAVAAIHAGWRGVIADVVPQAVARLAQHAGEAAGGFTAAIGPCIGFDAFEVGEEVIGQFAELGERLKEVSTAEASGSSQYLSAGLGEAIFRRVGGGKGRVDLRGAIYRQLCAAGVRTDRIDVSDRCTHRDADEFFSHRRESGLTGRMAALIGARE